MQDYREMRFLRAIAGSPIEVVSGLVLVGAGIYVSSVGSSAAAHKTGLLTVGGLLTAVGGILISWIASKAVAKEQARDDFRQQLANLSRNLGQAASQISRAVEQAQVRDITADTGLALISQANRMIYGQVNEISVIQGAGFDPAYLLETASKLDALALELESSGRGDEAVEQVRRELERVRSNLSRGSSTRTYSRIQATCPTCGAGNEIELGDVPGDTAAVTCSKCSTRYNAHRASDGRSFTRPAGPSELPRNIPAANADRSGERWHFSCPNCQHAMSSLADHGQKTLLCTECFAAVGVDPGRHVAEQVGEYTRTTAPIVGKTGARPLLPCPVCATPRNALLNTGESYIAICIEHLQAMEVTHEVWSAWRAEHDGRSEGSGTASADP